MSVKLFEIINYIEEIAPVHLAEEWDNVGLLVGSRDREVKSVMVCLDVTSKVVEEAIRQKTDLIISHHPFIFKGLKRVVEEDSKGKLVQNLIRNDISVYSAHTNLDVTFDGINEYLTGLFELRDVQNLKEYKSEKLYKIVVFVPLECADEVRNVMCRAGAGWIGNYSDCTFMTKGTGTFKPLEGTNPFIGTKGNLERTEEYRLETIASQELLHNVISEMIKAHPYEEVAYDVYPLEIKGKQYGFGKVGNTAQPMSLDKLIEFVKKKLGIKNVRLIGSTEKEITKVGVFCGSFDESLLGIVRKKAEVLITGDIKYHTALEIEEMGLCVIDAGHFGTEHIIVPKLAKNIASRFQGIEVIGSSVEKDPFNFC